MPKTPPRFGIMTAPSQVDCRDILRVWREADTIPRIEHAWLFDHLMPIGGDPSGPTYEGWTLLSALAASRSGVGDVDAADVAAGPVSDLAQPDHAGAGGRAPGGEGERRRGPRDDPGGLPGQHVDRVAGAGEQVPHRERRAGGLPELLADRAVLPVDLVLGDRVGARAGGRPRDSRLAVGHRARRGLAGRAGRSGHGLRGVQHEDGQGVRRQCLAGGRGTLCTGDGGVAIGVRINGWSRRRRVAGIVDGDRVRVVRVLVEQQHREVAVGPAGGVRGDRGPVGGGPAGTGHRVGRTCASWTVRGTARNGVFKAGSHTEPPPVQVPLESRPKSLYS
jgi:hypothetical protein